MRKLWVLAFWCAMAGALVLASVPHPPMLPGEPSDKFQHILGFTVLAALGTLAFPGKPVRLLIGLAAFGGLIELIQSIPALHRDAELLDWLADISAVVAVLAFIQVAFRTRRRDAVS